MNVGSGDVRALGTPRLIAWAEAVSCDAVAGLLASGQTSVGSRIEFDHKRPSAVGETITVEAIIEASDDRRVTVLIEATNAHGDQVGSGSVRRVFVDKEQFDQALRSRVEDS